MSGPPTAQATGIGRSWLPLVLVCVAAALLPAALTGSSVALPDIGTDLETDLAPLQWVVHAYNVMFASFMLASGGLADLFGRRLMFTLGLSLFALSSLASGLISDIVLLDVLRGASGAGAAAVMTAGSALLAQVFTDPATRARAFSMLGASFGMGLALGPSTAGLLVGAFGWRGVFIAQAVIAGVVLLGAAKLPESRDPDATSVDWWGAITFTSSLFLLTLSVVEGPQRGWGDPVVLGGFALAAALMVAFAVAERVQRRPMFELSLLGNPRFIAVCLVPVLLAFGFVCLLVFLPSYFIGVNGMSPQGSGLTMMLLTVPVMGLPLFAGQMLRFIPVGWLLGLSMLLIGLGAAWLTTLNPETTLIGLLGPLMVIGSGVGISFGIIDGAAVSSVEPARAGMAAGMFNTMRLASEAIAVAGMGAFLVSLTQTNLTEQLPAVTSDEALDIGALANRVAQGDLAGAAGTVTGDETEVFGVMAASYTDAFQLTLWILAAVCLAGVPFIIGLLREPRPSADEGAPADADPATDAPVPTPRSEPAGDAH
ncbi:MFS transporter [Nocardiopsis sp. NPDC050513]|uniref:MFS transporter n=1 Tax=Nocardiopsis sp. NPDC050513 TaxID=3364338 RepID=UPI0037A958CD